MISNGDAAVALHQNTQTRAIQNRAVRAGVGNECEVTAGSGMSVDVDTGEVFFNGNPTPISAGNVTVPSADSSDPRKDVIYIDGAGNPQITTGTPNSPDPAAETGEDTWEPAPPDKADADVVVLAEVYVAANETDITDAEITDRRILIDNIAANEVEAADRLAAPDYDDLSQYPTTEIGDLGWATGNGSFAEGLWAYDGSQFVRVTPEAGTAIELVDWRYDVRQQDLDPAAQSPISATGEQILATDGSTIAWLNPNLNRFSSGTQPQSYVPLSDGNGNVNWKAFAHGNLTNIGASDHHIRPSAGQFMSEDLNNNFDVEPGNIQHYLLDAIQSDDHHTRPSAGTLLSEDGSANFNVQEGNIDATNTSTASATGESLLATDGSAISWLKPQLTRFSSSSAPGQSYLALSDGSGGLNWKALAHGNLLGVNSDDHHTRPGAGTGIVDSGNTHILDESYSATWTSDHQWNGSGIDIDAALWFRSSGTDKWKLSWNANLNKGVMGFATSSGQKWAIDDQGNVEITGSLTENASI